ncbi:MAG: hypothetical protein R3250_17630, partial [Melioribacteraceae bacterium]|nr:hypothetical protein [Melioribacteraceae bacterium]
TWRPDENAVSIDIGEYNPILGKSYNEISASARSMHKSQGFGVSPTRGEQFNHFNYFAGDTAQIDLFDGIDLTWNRLSGAEKIEGKINHIISKYQFGNPEKIIPDLVKLYNEIESLKDKHWIEIKLHEIMDLIKICSGLWMESNIWEPELSLGQSIDVRNVILNRSNYPVTLEEIITTHSNKIESVNKKLEKNVPLSIKLPITIPLNSEYSQPYWLKGEHDGKMFSYDISDNFFLAENEPEIKSIFTVRIDGNLFDFKVPVKHKWNDAIEGEQSRPIVIRPDLSISVNRNNYVFPNGKSHLIKVDVTTRIDLAKGRLFIDLPAGWYSDQKFHDFELVDKNDLSTFAFKVSHDKNAKSGIAKIRAVMNDKSYNNKIVQIDYPHIEFQTVLKPVEIDLVKLDISVELRRIGYIMGSGDLIPQSLEQLDYNIDLLEDKDLDQEDLSKYDVIICGIRAFNTRENLERQQKRLIDFVENGGIWIVQHNTRFGLQAKQIGPYPFSTTGRDRIAEEDAPIEKLVPD